jgi:hypothetical protein
MAPNPIVTLNHAVALAMVRGPQAGLALLETVDTPISYPCTTGSTRSGHTYWKWPAITRAPAAATERPHA